MSLPPLCILRRVISSTVRYFETPCLQIMTERTPPREKRTAPKASFGINGLIGACNKNDRFKLLEDDSVLPANLDNPIHAIFCWFPTEGPMKQMLQLASHFITHDSLLVFLVPLLYGRELTITTDGNSKTYLSDPMANISEAQRTEYLHGVREALYCLSHRISFQFQPPAKRVYARTIRSDERPAHTWTCFFAFQRKYSCTIEMADYFENYYNDQGGYTAASRCSQFRHDFLFAATLVHEVMHAIGVLRRGNLNEPYIRADCPETEWGYGWEHFMFGNIINPQDRTRPGTHLLMRKVWADQKVAEDVGGKEYCDVPMSYIAQWFRKETWAIVEEHGPAAIPPPTTHFKIQSSNKHSAWVVSSDSPEIKHDLATLHKQWKQRNLNPEKGSPTLSNGRMSSSKIFWCFQTTEQLQMTNVPLIARISPRVQCRLTRGQTLPCTKRGSCVPTHEEAHVMTVQHSVTVCRSSPSSNPCSSRKRCADSLDASSRASKIIKQ